jgi:hypothetical protein
VPGGPASGAHRGARHSDREHIARPDRSQGRRSRAERGTRGGDIVDEEHRAPRSVEPGSETRSAKPLGAGAPRLRAGGLLADEEAPAGKAELTGQMPGDQLGLVEAALASTGVTSRRPSDHVDVDAGTHTDLLEPSAHQTREMSRHRAAIVELEAEHHAPRPTGERDRQQHTRPLRRARQQSKPTGATDGCAGCVATGTPHREHPRQHATQTDRTAAST